MPTAMVARPGPASVSGGVTWRRHCIVSGDFHLDFGDASERLVLARPQLPATGRFAGLAASYWPASSYARIWQAVWMLDGGLPRSASAATFCV